MDIKYPFDRNKPFNHLPLLPPGEEIIDKEVLLQWGYASRNLAELNKNLYRLPNPLMFINTLALQEAKSSSEIENIFTTDDELYKAIADSFNEENASANTKEVLRYREALWAGYNHIREKKNISFETVLQVYQKVKNTSQRLRSPQSQVVIRRGDSEFRSGEIVYTPPRGKELLDKLMDNLISYLADNKICKSDPLIKMAVAHYQFEAIHPFSDGNGRTGRILNLLYLVSQGLLAQPVLYLSRYIIENKDDYYYRLTAVTQRAEWKPWLMYMMKAIQYTASYSNHLIDDIILQMESTLEYGKQTLKWYNKEINDVLFTQPYIKPKLLGEILNRTSRTTLTKYMNDLMRTGILTPKQDGREVFYLNHDLIRILEG